MRHYKTSTEIRAIEDGQEHLVQADWILLTDEELQAIINPPKTEEQILAEQVQEAKAFLDRTDKKVLPDYDFEDGDETYEWYVEKRKEARAFVRANVA